MAAASPLGPEPMTWAGRPESLMRLRFFRPLDHAEFAAGGLGDHRRVEADQFAPPPVAGAPFLFHRSKPILPQYSFHVAGRALRVGICTKEAEHVGIVLE